MQMKVITVTAKAHRECLVGLVCAVEHCCVGLQAATRAAHAVPRTLCVEFRDSYRRK